MFTGIIEEIGKVTNIQKDSPETLVGNLHLTVEANFVPELKIDQSIAHNGVCLTVVSLGKNSYTVTAIEETLKKTNLGDLRVGDPVNLERGMMLHQRLDGHIVQGHVDHTGICEKIEDQNGSHIFTFSYDQNAGSVTIEKGSITINGVSLTVVDSSAHGFSVAIVPYTFGHTTFKNFKTGDVVNLEFDVIGKYVKRLLGNK